MSQKNLIQISGFTIVRNATLLNYPLRESILSVLPLCHEFIIGCGDSSDNTLELCKEIQKEFPNKIKLFETVWKQESQSGGWQLKYQTDAAMQKCQGNWCFYIQADEVIHEDDLNCVRKAVEKVHLLDHIDGVLFNYIHFYGNFEYAIRGRNWYRQEVRCFKNGRGIESFRDAQGFRKNGNRITAYHSGASVFHYGYVRTSPSLKVKSTEMSRWWGIKPKEGEKNFQLIHHVGLYRYVGAHPKLMKDRIANNLFYFNPSNCPRKWDHREIKNLITLLWESIFHFRLGEYRNYIKVK